MNRVGESLRETAKLCGSSEDISDKISDSENGMTWIRNGTCAIY